MTSKSHWRFCWELNRSDRLRPILTTSITTIIGLIPLALSYSQWFPLYMAIIFGLLSATLMALLVVPGLYLQLTSHNSEAVSEREVSVSTGKLCLGES